MLTQEFRLTVPNENVYDNIYNDYIACLKQAKIMISDYYDSADLKLLRQGIMFRLRMEDGHKIVQTKKSIVVKADGLFVSESKEEIKDSISASRMHDFLLRGNKIDKFHKYLTLRTLRQMYFCSKFDFILDKTQYENHLTKESGVLYEIEMEILSFNENDRRFLSTLMSKYNLVKSKENKVERIMRIKASA
ncbi:MAG: CYTH domain-containing protein [Patescibacteria group bacterium]